MNRELIEQRCRAGGLSIHQVAMDAWVDHVFMWDDPGDHGDDRIPLGVLRRLSSILDTDLSELTDTPYRQPVPGDNDAGVADDIRVEAVLGEFPDGVTRDALSEAFKWPLARVERALAALEIRLRPSGRRLRQIGWHQYSLGPNLAILTTAERSQLIRSTAPDMLDQDQADAIYQILHGFGTVAYFQKGPGQGAVQSLEHSGLATRQRGHYNVSAEVAFSLRWND